MASFTPGRPLPSMSPRKMACMGMTVKVRGSATSAAST